MDLTISFGEFLTMILKFFDTVINDSKITVTYDEGQEEGDWESLFTLAMIMNTDGTATLKFMKKLKNFKSLEQLSLDMKLGDMSAVTENV